MDETIRFETWDVFTDRRFAGNPLAVMFDADGLDTETMMAITREFDYSESVFVVQPESPGAEARIRIFTPAGELPFAGHPTVGAACAIARRRGLSGDFVLDLAAGRFPISRRVDSTRYAAEFENPNRPVVAGKGPEPKALESALGLVPGSIDAGAHIPRRVGAGIDFIYARAPIDAARAARLDLAAWGKLGMDDECGVLLYAAVDDGTSDATWHVRMFAPHIGVPEDPATGSAAAALPGQILVAGDLRDGAHDWVVEQGVEMGRPSRIRVRFDVRGGRIDRLRVGGSAVPVMAGSLKCSRNGN